MDDEAIHRLRNAVATAREAASRARLDNCDGGDIDDALEALDRELALGAVSRAGGVPVSSCFKWRARLDSNQRPAASEAATLSI